ncbi:MAG: hypothetical protein HY344_00875 [Candidatus Levybacteria bacterium]|nr:hypothetical protein [Candidatus Levybacteria bacterium]
MKLLLKFFLLLIAFISFFYLFANTTNAANTTRIHFTNYRSSNFGTNWQIEFFYNGHGAYDFVGPLRRWTGYTDFSGHTYYQINSYRPWASDTVIWSSACVDPESAVNVNGTPSNPNDINNLLFSTSIDASCYENQTGSNKYKGCGNPDRHGDVYQNSVCPANNSNCCVQAGQVWCNCQGGAYCGSDANRCNRYGPEQCNYNAGPNNCTRNVNNNAGACLGVNGCQCLSNADCGGTVCGATGQGGSQCVLYGKRCNNGQCELNPNDVRDNNASQCGGTCGGQADLRVNWVSFPGGNYGNNPDPASPVSGGPLSNATVQVQNYGNLGTQGAFNVRVDNGAGSGVTEQTAGLGIGEARNVVINNIPRPTAGSYTATGIADVGNNIPESNNNNNSNTGGYTITAYIAGIVYNDANGNGNRDAGEGPAVGSSVSIAGVGTYGVDANGYYRSGELGGGTYYAYINPPGGYGATTASPLGRNLGPNSWAQFGVRQATATTWVNVYVDNNYNCVWDAGDTGYGGAGVSVAGQGAGYYVTNGNGQFVLSNIPSGYSTYTLGTPGGYSIACVGNPQGLTTGPGGTYVVNFPIRRDLATTWVNVFSDLNANWVWDAGETGYAGATVTVAGQGAGSYATNGNGQIALTAPTGYSTYTLSVPPGFNLRSGNPVGVTTPPSGQVVSFPLRPVTAPTCSMSASPGAVNPGGTSALSLSYSLPSQVTQQPSITWYSDTGNVPGSSITNQAINHPARTASATWNSPNPYWNTSTAYPSAVICNAGADPVCSSCGSNGITVVPLHSITGNVFVDTNRNGVKDGGEANYTGGTTITRNPAGGSLTYPSAGAYSITSLNVGDYTISYTSLPAAYEMTTASAFAVHPQNGACSTGGNPNASCTNGNIANLNFGIDLIPTYSVSGNVFVDINVDGRKNAGELNYTAGPITITRSPANGSVSTSNGAFDITGLYAGDYIIAYTNKPDGYELTHPGGFPPQFAIHVGGGVTCSTGGSNDAVCAGGSITSLNFGMTNAIPWIQTQGADLWFNTAVDNEIPPGASCQPVLSKDYEAGGTPGIIYSGGSIDVGSSAQISSTNWNVENQDYSPVGGNTKTSYAYVKSHTAESNIINMDTSVCGAGGLANCQLSLTLANGVYRANGDLHLTRPSYSFPANRDFVILVNGDLYLEGDIDTPAGSTVLFSAGDENGDGSGGNIYVTPGVGTTPNTSTAPNLEGWFSADKSFIVQGSQTCPTPDERLNVEGSIIINALGGGIFDNQRDLCAGNLACPVFYIKERPDFILNAPRFLQAAPRLWQEVAP